MTTQCHSPRLAPLVAFVGAFVGAFTFSLPAAADLIDDLPAGSWLEIPDTKLFDVTPDPRPAGSIAAVITAWNGAVLDSQCEQLILWGGGHTDYSGNEVYAFSLRSLQWSRLSDPTPADQVPNSGSPEVYLDNNPSARHTYGGLAYIPELHAMWAQGGSVWRGGGSSSYTWLFHLPNGPWERRADVPQAKLNPVSAYDPNSGRVFHRAKTKILAFDPQSESIPWEDLARPATGWSYSMSGTIVPGRFMVFIGGLNDPGKGFYDEFDLNTHKYRRVTTSGATAIQDGIAPGITYEPGPDRLVAWKGGNDVYFLDVRGEDRVWTKTTGIGAKVPKQAKNGTYGRFQYVANRNVFVMVSDIFKNVFVYRASDGTGKNGALPAVCGNEPPAAPTSLQVR